MSIWKVVLPVAMLAFYGAMIAAHGAFDHDREPHAERLDAVDGTALFRRLAARGLAALPEIEAEIAEGGDAWKVFEPYLPSVEEPWVDDVAALLAGEDVPVPLAADDLLVEPRGRVLPGRLLVTIRETSGPLFLGRKDIPERFDITPGRHRLPVELAHEPGNSHVLVVSDADGNVRASSAVEVVSAEKARELSRLSAALNKLIADARMKLYANAVLAMSRGLHDQAALILLDGFAEGDDLERGLAWRRVWLFHRRGDVAQRDALITKLRRGE